MKTTLKCLVLALLAVFTTMPLQAQKGKTAKTKGKVLVAYFSATGTTAAAAAQIAKATEGTLFVIQPVQKYSAADLDWRNKESRSSVEMKNPKSRPAMKGKAVLKGYDTVYLGYPIWWNVAPHIINTFIESSKLEGKALIPFATSGGSDITNSVRELQKAYPTLKWQKGLLLNGKNPSEVKHMLGR